MYSNFELVGSIPFFRDFGKAPSCVFAVVISLLLAVMCMFYVNAKWNRQMETKCDLNSVEFADGEAMILALTKITNLRSKQLHQSRFLPKFYPTLEQRICDIRKAMDDKKTVSLS